MGGKGRGGAVSATKGNDVALGTHLRGSCWTSLLAKMRRRRIYQARKEVKKKSEIDNAGDGKPRS